MLLKGELDFIFKNFDLNFNNTGKNFLKKLAKDEKRIDDNNLFFSINNEFVVKNADFLKEFGTLYDLLIYLLNNSMRIIISSEDQIKFFEAIIILKTIISSMKTGIKDQGEEGKKKLFAKQENFLSNAEMLLAKRKELIKQFTNNNIISRDKIFYDAPKKSEESISKKSEQKSDQSIPKLVQVSEERFDFIKLKINKNKDLATMINNKRYTLNDANKLVNKIAEQKIAKNNAIEEYNDLVNKAEHIAELRSTEPRQKMLKIFNYLGEMFNEPTEGKRLKILTPDQILSRLPITLAQLKAGNNSKKLQNEIRQLLHSLYRSKKHTKQLHKSLISII